MNRVLLLENGAMWVFLYLSCTYVFLVNGEVNGEPVKLPDDIDSFHLLSSNSTVHIHPNDVRTVL